MFFAAQCGSGCGQTPKGATMKQKTTFVVTVFFVCSILLQACQTAGVAETPSAPAAGAPPVFFVADGKLYQQVNGAAEMAADLTAIGEIYGAVKNADSPFVLSATGLYRVDLASQKALKTAVMFDAQPLYGVLKQTSDPNVLIYEVSISAPCGASEYQIVMGLYRIKEQQAQAIPMTEQGYTNVLGMTADQKIIYGAPVGCDPEFDRFLTISTDSGKTAQEFSIVDAEQKEYGFGYIAVSPNLQYVAFMTSLNRFGVYNLNDGSIKRLELPNSPSTPSPWGGLLWAADSQKVYFSLNSVASQKSYGLWSFDVAQEKFTQVTQQLEGTPQLISISPDGQWLLFQGEQNVGYVNLRAGEQVNVPISVKELKLAFW
jgi:hypothetical protein